MTTAPDGSPDVPPTPAGLPGLVDELYARARKIAQERPSGATNAAPGIRGGSGRPEAQP